MGHDDNGVAARNEVVGQPFDTLDIEVVGGLVEDEDVGVGHQRCCQCRAAPLPTRQLVSAPGEQFGHADARKHVTDPRIPRPFMFGETE